MLPSPPPPAGRLLLAALVAAAVGWLLGSSTGMASRFALALPVTVAAGGWLALRDGGSPLSRAALALLLLTPAIGTRLWAQIVAEQDLDHIAAATLALWLPRAAADCLAGVPALLAGAAAALAVLRAPRTALLLALGAMATAGAEQHLLWVGAALQDARWSTAAWGGLLVSGWGLLPLLGMLLCPRLPDRRLWGLWLATAAGLAGLAAAPLPRFLGVLPVQAVSAALPEGPPGLPMGSAPRVRPGDLSALREAGLRAFPRDRWWCSAPHRRWPHRVRAEATLEAPADLPLSALADDLRTLGLHSVHLLALQGRTAAAPGPGALGARLAAPAARFLLDPAPEDAPRVTVAADGTPLWPGEAGTEAGDGASCVLVSTPELTVGAVYALGRRLGDPGGRCAAGLGLDLGWALAPCAGAEAGDGW